MGAGDDTTRWSRIATTAGGCFLATALTARLLGVDGASAPVSVTTGLALVALRHGGIRMLVPAALGEGLALVSAAASVPVAALTLLSGAIAVAISAQLVQRLDAATAIEDETRSPFLFAFVAAPVGALVGGVTGTLGGVALGTLPLGDVLPALETRVVALVLGMVLVAPLAEPRARFFAHALASPGEIGAWMASSVVAAGLVWLAQSEPGARSSLLRPYLVMVLVGMTTLRSGLLPGLATTVLVSWVPALGAAHGQRSFSGMPIGSHEHSLLLHSYLLFLGALTYGIGIAVDRWQHALRRLERISARHRFALDASDIGVWDWDLRREPVPRSLRWPSSLGWSQEELENGVTPDWKDLIHPDDVAGVKAAMVATLKGQASAYRATFRMRARDGSWRWIEDLGRVRRRDAGGRATRIAGICRDVSNEHAREEALCAAQAEAESASSARRQFLDTMSHEVRTPLNGILGMTELLLDSPLQEEQRDFVVTLRRSSRSLLGLVRQIFDDAEPARARQREQVDFAVEAVVSESVRGAGEDPASGRVPLGWAISDELPETLRGDPSRLRLALDSMLEHLIPMVTDGGLLVRASADERPDGSLSLRLAVETTSAEGFDHDARVRLAESIAAISSDAAEAGPAPWIARVRRLADAMGGELGLDGGIGRGASLWLRVPVERREKRALSVQESAGDFARRSRSARPGVVLVVDDNAVNLRIASRLLQRAGHDVDTASNGREAVQAVARRRYDAVLMDCQMPELDGYDATRAIRAAERAAGQGTRVPIIAVTANALSGDRERCLDAGMDDYLEKPVDGARLDAALVRWLGEAEPPDAANVA